MATEGSLDGLGSRPARRVGCRDADGPDPSAAADLPRIAAALRDASRRAAADLIYIGTLLGRVRAALPRGQWLAWCERELGWPKTSVYRLLAVGEAFGGQPDAVLARFEPTALYALAQPATPAAARAFALQQARDGRKVTRADALAVLDAHRAGPDPVPTPETRAERAADAAPGPAADPTGGPAWAAACALLAAGDTPHLSAAADADTGERVYFGRRYRAGELRPTFASGLTAEELVVRLTGREKVRACSRCGRDKPLSEFPKNAARGTGGRQHTCRVCERDRFAAMRVRKKAAQPPWPRRRAGGGTPGPAADADAVGGEAVELARDATLPPTATSYG